MIRRLNDIVGQRNSSWIPPFIPVPFVWILLVRHAMRVSPFFSIQNLLWFLTAFSLIALAEQTDNVVTGSCDHTYHHHCMMSWLNTKLYKNDCPYCRQELWTASVYDEILCQLKEADKDVHVATPAHCNEQETLGRQ